MTAVKARRLLVTLALLVACHRPVTSAAPPLVVVSIDGLRPAELLEADALGLKIPELRRLRNEGAFARVQGVLPTVTYPSHTTLMTGVRPKVHGIHANLGFDPFGRNGGGWQWYAEDVRVPTLWQAAEEAGIPSASLYWPVNVGGRARWTIAEVWRNFTDDRKLTRALSTPGLVAGLERELGELPPGQTWDVASDRVRARFAERVLETRKPRFATVHLLALDHEQHGRGTGTAEVHATLEKLDEIIGSLRRAAEAEGRANFCVVSDHGFQSIHTRVSLARIFADEKLLEHDGPLLRSYRAMTWSTGGTAAVMLNDPDDTPTLDAVKALLDRLRLRPELGIDRVLGRHELDELGGFPEAAFVIAMQPGFFVDDAVDGPVTSPPPGWAHGAHGYLPTEPAMLATFACAGPSVPARDLGTISMLDVAPTLATLMKITLPSAEGKSLF